VPYVALAFTLETLAFLAQPGHFIVCESSPGMGTSRGKIHGIGVFDKTLLPLLFGGLPVFSTFVEKSLNLQELVMVPDGCIFVICY
jgi:hypothetical protein